MKRRSRALSGAALSAAIVVTMGLTAGVASAVTSTVSPFDPPNGDNGASQGTISFFDESGFPVSSGDIATGPAFAVADTDSGRDGDTLASLYGATPVQGLAAGDWASALLAAPDTFAPPQVLPGELAGVTTAAVSGPFGAWMDLDAGYPADFPNTNVDQVWQNLYQLRIFTSGPGQALDASRYSSATILLNPEAGTWQQVYPRPVVTPTVTSDAAVVGTAATGETLICDVSFDSANSVEFSWFRNGDPIVDAVSATYKTRSADFQQDVSCQAVATSVDELTSSSTSNAVTITRGEALTNVLAPRIVGTKKVGQLVSCAPGRWTPKAATYSYRWLRNGKRVNGGTTHVLLIPRSFRGDELSCRVRANKSGFASGKALSAVKVVG